MKRKRLNLFKVSACLVLMLLFLFSFSGCLLNAPHLTHPHDYYGTREVGDFIVHFSISDYCSVRGTTEQGNTKRFLVIPKQIEDSPVNTFGEQLLLELASPVIKSDVLEKIYIENDIFYFSNSAFSIECPNFKKIICLSEWTSPKKYYGRSEYCPMYYPRKFCERYALERPDYPLNPANVSYYYNYEDADNDGYYWVDDCDYGKKIEFIPEDPVREGYTFGGWYKEPECITEWDYDKDTLPKEKTEDKETDVNGKTEIIKVTVYQETVLYAKWIEQ